MFRASRLVELGVLDRRDRRRVLVQLAEDGLRSRVWRGGIGLRSIVQVLMDAKARVCLAPPPRARRGRRRRAHPPQEVLEPGARPADFGGDHLHQVNRGDLPARAVHLEVLGALRHTLGAADLGGERLRRGREERGGFGDGDAERAALRLERLDVRGRCAGKELLLVVADGGGVVGVGRRAMEALCQEARGELLRHLRGGGADGAWAGVADVK